MRFLSASAALAAVALSLSLTALPASAAVHYPDDRGSTYDDLGVDVSEVPLTARSVDAFIASLEPETQAVIMGTCEHIMQNPLVATSRDSWNFCQVAVGG